MAGREEQKAALRAERKAREREEAAAERRRAPDLTLGTLAKVIADQVRPGTLRIRYRSLETATRDESTFTTQQAAALAAGRQRRLWQCVEPFYRDQGQEGTPYVTPAFLRGVARQADGRDVAKWNGERSDPALSNQVAADERAASAIGASSTPTVIIRGPGGTKGFVGDATYSDIAGAVKAVRRTAARAQQATWTVKP